MASFLYFLGGRGGGGGRGGFGGGGRGGFGGGRGGKFDQGPPARVIPFGKHLLTSSWIFLS